MSDIYATVRSKPFSGARVGNYDYMLDSNGVLRVWDKTAGHYTVCHSLSVSTVARIKAVIHVRTEK